jgi:urocanate hydratase
VAGDAHARSGCGHGGRAEVGSRARQAMLDYHAMGVPTFDYGNNIARSRTTKA